MISKELVENICWCPITIELGLFNSGLNCKDILTGLCNGPKGSIILDIILNLVTTDPVSILFIPEPVPKVVVPLNIDLEIIPGLFSSLFLTPILDSPKVSVSIFLIVICVAGVSIICKEVVDGEDIFTSL